MRTGRNKLAISLALLAAILSSTVRLSAQETKDAASSDWSRLNAVTSGSKLTIKLKNGQSIDGKLTGVSDTSLTLSVKHKSVDLNRQDVLSVFLVKKKSAAKATLIGLGVGAGAGAAVGVAGTREDGFAKLDHALTAGLTVLSAGAGALTGYLIGRSGRKRVLIYQALQP
jgi:hypothetical protein